MPFYANVTSGKTYELEVELPGNDLPFYYTSGSSAGLGAKGVVIDYGSDLGYRYKTNYRKYITSILYRDIQFLIAKDVIIAEADEANGRVKFKAASAYASYNGKLAVEVCQSSGQTNPITYDWIHNSNSSFYGKTMESQCGQGRGSIWWRASPMICAALNDNATRFTRIFDSTTSYSTDAPREEFTMCMSCSNPNVCKSSTDSGISTCHCCLDKDTKIELENGKSVNISEIKARDIIYGFENGQKVKTTVKMIYCAFPKKDTTLYQIETKSGKIIKITGHHPIMCQTEYKTIERTNGFSQISKNEILIDDDEIINIIPLISKDVVFNLKTDMDNFLANGIAVACEDTEEYEVAYINNKIGANNVKAPCSNSTQFM